MLFSSNRARRTIRPRLESLEDRATPDAQIAPAAYYDPTRVLVAIDATAADESATASSVASSPIVANVTPIGLGVYRVDLRDGNIVADAIPTLGGIVGVQGVSPDYELTSAAIPNDPSYSSQWQYQAPSSGSGGINAPAAWSVTTGTRSTVVAVIDSGVNTSHPDLAANIWTNTGEIAGNGVDDDHDGFVDDMNGADFLNNDGSPDDQYGHGTHVAGIIGAVGNNGVGVTGVDQATRIMALKFMGADGSGYTSNAVRAIDYAIAHGARIINASWGGGPYNAALQAAIVRARNSGILFVAAAGNNGANTDSSPFYPAGYITSADNVVTVAATTQADTLASWSNFGAATVTLAAPGENILSTTSGGGYGLKSGTSMAAPVVTGALALLLDANPGMNYQQAIARLKATVDPLSSLAGKTQTGGRLNLAKLLGASASPPPVASPPVSPPPTTTGAGPIITAGGFSGPRAGTFDRALVTFASAIDPSTFTAADVTVTGPNGRVNVSGVLPAAGSNTQFTLVFSSSQSGAGTYTLSVGPDVRDAGGRQMDQNNNGIGGETADVYTTSYTVAGTSPPPASPPASPPPPASPSVSPPPVSPPPPTTNTSRNYSGVGLPAPINDLRTTSVNIGISDNFTIADLNVLVDITHGRDWDLAIRLVAPDGRTVILFNRRGGDGDNLTGTIFDDQATTSVTAAAAPFTGLVKPEQALSLFNGMSAKGLWSVQVFDLSGGVTGTVNAVTLQFTATNSGTDSTGDNSPAPGSSTVTVDPLPELTFPDAPGSGRTYGFRRNPFSELAEGTRPIVVT